MSEKEIIERLQEGCKKLEDVDMLMAQLILNGMIKEHVKCGELRRLLEKIKLLKTNEDDEDKIINNILQNRPEYLNDKIELESQSKTIAERNYAKGWNDCNKRWYKIVVDIGKEGKLRELHCAPSQRDI